MMTTTPTRHSAAPIRSKRSGRKPSSDHAPQQRPHDEHPAVRGQDAPEVRVGLQRRDEAVHPSATTPGPDPPQPRCSRTPCHTSQAPPISARAASTNNSTDRTTVMAGSSPRDPTAGARSGRSGPGMIGRCERTPGRPGARAPLRRRTRAALAGALHRAPHVAARLGARRPRPLPLHLQRERHHRGLRLGPRDRPPPPGHRPAQRHLRRHPRRPTASWCGGSPTPTATSTATGSPNRSRAATTSPRSPASRTGTPRASTSGARSSRRARRPTRAPGSGCAAATAPPR